MTTAAIAPEATDDDRLIESVLDDLRRHGASRTTPRRTVISALVRAHRHLSADELLYAVQLDGRRVHRSTVYRTLHELERQHAVTRCVLGDGSARFYVTDQFDAHVHLHCEDCRQDIEADTSTFTGLERAVYRQYGFVVRVGQVAQVGVCASCVARRSALSR